MKKIFLASAIVAIVVIALSCGKSIDTNASCTGPKAVNDSSTLLAFARALNITPTADTSWLYYQVVDPGTGPAPVYNSKIYVRYVGRFMDGTYFDSTGAVTRKFPLDSVIKGWQYGIPKIKSGGHVKLLVPSALAYGCVGVAPIIPPSAPLYFDIYLDSLK